MNGRTVRTVSATLLPWLVAAVGAGCEAGTGRDDGGPRDDGGVDAGRARDAGRDGGGPRADGGRLPANPAPTEGATIRVVGRAVEVDGVPLEIRGVCWSPVDRGDVLPPDFGGFVDEDAPLMAAAGINAVRTFSAIPERRVLDVLQANGIWVIETVFVADIQTDDEVLDVVRAHRDHPAILMWALGNEWNFNGLYAGRSIEDSVERIEALAQAIQAIDPDHPVATVYGEVPPGDVVDAMPSVDVWGLNVYRGLTLDVFDAWAAEHDQPLFLAEYGADAYDARVDAPNPEAQATATRILTEAWIARSVRRHEDGVTLGGTIFEWSDEWWKAPGSPDVQDTGGVAPGGGPHPDATFNEEWWGIVDVDRNPRPAYGALRALFLDAD